MEKPAEIFTFYEGKASEKSVPYLYSSRVYVKPFAGVRDFRSNKNDIMGVGIYEEKQGVLDFSGYVVPHHVIASCRAIKILEKLSEIRKGDLDIALWVAHRDPEWYRNSLGNDTELISRIGGNSKREEILRMVPENLDEILSLLKKNNISFGSREIDEETRQGVLKPTNT